MGKKFVSDDKDKQRLKAQRETIVSMEREIKLLKQQIRTLEKALNRPEKSEKEEKVLPPKKLTPIEEREAARTKWANWSKERAKQTPEE